MITGDSRPETHLRTGEIMTAGDVCRVAVQCWTAIGMFCVVRKDGEVDILGGVGGVHGRGG